MSISFCRSDTSYNGKNKDSIDEIDTANYNRMREEPLRISGCQQFLAILYKKGIFMREQWFYWFMLFSFPIAAIVISFLSINYKLFKMGNTTSKLIDLHMNQIATSDAEILIWLENSLPDKNRYQQALHKVIENENIRTKYLTYPRNRIKDGELRVFRSKCRKCTNVNILGF